MSNENDQKYTFKDVAGLEEEKEARLRELIANRNYFGVEELLDNCGVKEETKAAFRVLEELTGGIEIMECAKKNRFL